MAEYAEFLNEDEQRALREGDGALRRSQALAGFVDFAGKLGLSQDQSEQMIGTLRSRLDTMSDNDARKIARAIGKVGGLLSVEVQGDAHTPATESLSAENVVVEPVLDEPLQDANENEVIIIESVTEVRSHADTIRLWEDELELPKNSLLFLNANTKPENDEAAASYQEAIASLRDRIASTGSLETIADFTPPELINLRMALGWYKAQGGDNMRPGIVVATLAGNKKYTPAKRLEIQSAVESGFSKLTDAIISA